MVYEGHIFISYARKDGRNYASRLEKSLHMAGFKTWRDTRDIDPNQDFSAELERAIAESSHVVCCITPDTTRDDSFVRREISYASAIKKPIIPLIFNNTLPPIQIFNVTRIHANLKKWDQTMANIVARLKHNHDKSYEQFAITTDPYHDYLVALYDQIVNYLNLTVFSLITLTSEATPDAVNGIRTQVLPMAFFDMAGIKTENEHRIRFNNFQDAFEKYDGRILLLGEPGAGKTTTLFAFARDAVAARIQDATLPLPILAPIATWDNSKQTPLIDWLATTIPALNHDDIAYHVNAGQALLLLDGLDELGREREDEVEQNETKKMTPIKRRNIIEEDEANNPIVWNYDPRIRFLGQIKHLLRKRSTQSSGQNCLVIACRLRDYEELEEKIVLNGAITLEPLNDDQMREYLREMPDLWIALESDDDLREVARTPLLLSLFTFAFRDLPEETKQLRDLKYGDLRDKIFETYVRRRFERELRKPHIKIPFSLDDIYEILGKSALENVLDEKAENIFRPDRFDNRGSEHSKLFVEMALQLNLLVRGERKNLRFIHLGLRDYFAFSYAINHLTDNFRYKAARGLDALDDKRASSALASVLLRDEDVVMRRMVAETLSKFDDRDTLNAFIAALNDQDIDIRRVAVNTLSGLNNVITLDAFIDALQDSDSVVRSTAVDALEMLNDKRAIQALIYTLRDQDEDVRVRAKRALSILCDDQSIDILIAALEDENAYVRRSCAIILGKLRASAGIEALKNLLSDTRRIFYLEEKRVCDVSAEVLIRIGTPEAINVVEMWQKAEQDAIDQ